MDYEDESANEPPDELDGQLSINDVLLELGEKPVLSIIESELSDEEIAAFFENETDT